MRCRRLDALSQRQYTCNTEDRANTDGTGQSQARGGTNVLRSKTLTDHINVRRLHPRARRSDRGTRGAGGPGGGVVRWHRTPPAAAPAGWRVAALEPAPGAPVPRVASVKLRPPREIDVRSCTCPGGGACTWPVAPDVLAFCLRCVVRLFVRLEKYYGRARPPGNGATRNGTAPIVPAGHAGGYRRRSRNAE
jgi:hypothetical protein